MSPESKLFKPRDGADLDNARFSSFSELVSHQYKELAQIPGLWQTYVEALRSLYEYYDEVIVSELADGIEIPDFNDDDELAYRSLSPEERTALKDRLSADNIFAVTKLTVPPESSALYKLNQLDHEGNCVPLTEVIVCSLRPGVGIVIDRRDIFSIEQAEVIVRLADESDSFLRSK